MDVLNYTRTFIVVVLSSLFVAIPAASYNSYTNHFAVGDGFNFVGSLFGGASDLLVALAILAVFGLTVGLAVWLAVKEHHVTLAVYVALAILGAALLGVNWVHIHLDFGTFVPVLTILFPIVVTAAIELGRKH